jgi:hypothetical protein
MNCLDIELAIAQKFNPSVNIIVPNVCWGLQIHECDILICTPSNYLTEVEIKTSRADLKADTKKKHQHQSNKIKRLFFAIPEALKPHIEHIPERAGILVINEHYKFTSERVQTIREAQTNKLARPISATEREHLAHLGTMRIWTLKDTISKYCKGRIQFDAIASELQGASYRSEADGMHYVAMADAYEIIKKMKGAY